MMTLLSLLIVFLTFSPLSLTRTEEDFENHYKFTKRNKYLGLMQQPHGESQTSSSYQSRKYVDLDPSEVQIHPDSYLKPKYLIVENEQIMEVLHNHEPENPSEKPDNNSPDNLYDWFDKYFNEGDQKTSEAEKKNIEDALKKTFIKDLKPNKDKSPSNKNNNNNNNVPSELSTTSKYDILLESIYNKVIKSTTKYPDNYSNKYFNALEILFNKSIVLPSLIAEINENPYHVLYDLFEKYNNIKTTIQTEKTTSTTPETVHTTLPLFENATTLDEIKSELTKVPENYYYYYVNNNYDDSYYDTDEPNDHNGEKYYKQTNQDDKQKNNPSTQLTNSKLTSTTPDLYNDHAYDTDDRNNTQHANDGIKPEYSNEHVNSDFRPQDEKQDGKENEYGNDEIKPNIFISGRTHKHKHHDKQNNDENESHSYPDNNENDKNYEEDHTLDYNTTEQNKFTSELVDKNALLASMYRELINAVGEVAKKLHRNHSSHNKDDTTSIGNAYSDENQYSDSTIQPSYQQTHLQPPITTTLSVVNDMKFSESENGLPEKINIRAKPVSKSKALNPTANTQLPDSTTVCHSGIPGMKPHGRILHSPENVSKEEISGTRGDTSLNPVPSQNRGDIIHSPITSNQVHARNYFNNSSMVVKLNFNVVPASKTVEMESIGSNIPEDKSTLQKTGKKSSGNLDNTGRTVVVVPLTQRTTQQLTNGNNKRPRIYQTTTVTTDDTNNERQEEIIQVEESLPFPPTDQTSSTLSPLELLALSYVRRGSEIPDKLKQCIALKQMYCIMDILEEKSTKTIQTPPKASTIVPNTTVKTFTRTMQGRKTIKALSRTTPITSTERTLSNFGISNIDYEDEHEAKFNPYWKERFENRLKTNTFPTTVKPKVQTDLLLKTTVKTEVQNKPIKTTAHPHHRAPITANPATTTANFKPHQKSAQKGKAVTTHRTILTDDDFLEDTISNQEEPPEESLEKTLPDENRLFNPHWFNGVKDIFLNAKKILPEPQEHPETPTTSRLNEDANNKDDFKASNSVIPVTPLEPVKKQHIAKPKRNSSTVRKCGGPRKPVFVEVLEQSNFIPVSDTRFLQFPPETRSDGRRKRKQRRVYQDNTGRT